MEYEISVQDFSRLREGAPAESAAQFCLLDVRQPWETEIAALPGGYLIPMDELPDRVAGELRPDAHIVVYCHHGRRSLAVVMWLREQGFARAQSLTGGIEEWSQTIDPSVPRY
ncbi:MAG: rhodanese-like domain-containing protein [Acidobacteriaceae bacterium]